MQHYLEGRKVNGESIQRGMGPQSWFLNLRCYRRGRCYMRQRKVSERSKLGGEILNAHIRGASFHLMRKRSRGARVLPTDQKQTNFG
jgi:hypothetical protein